MARSAMPRRCARRFFQGTGRHLRGADFGRLRDHGERIGRLGHPLRSKVVGRQMLVSQRHDFPRDVFQLADVSGPGMAQQQIHRRFAHFRLRPLEQRCIFLEEKFQQRGDVFFSIPQRRQAQVHSVDPVIKLFPEPPALHLVLKVSRGGRNDAHAAAALRRRATAVGEQVKQPFLCGRFQLIDLIQKQRSAAGRVFRQ